MDKKYIESSSTKKADTFTINGCGLFQESQKHLTKAEASLLYIELHKWLFSPAVEPASKKYDKEEVISLLLNYKSDLLVEITKCREEGKTLKKEFTDNWISQNIK